MKILKKILLILVSIIALIIIGLWVTGNGFILTGISRTYLTGNPTANIDDNKYFDTRVIETNEVKEWELAFNYQEDKLPQAFRDDLADNNAVAFLVTQKGKLVTESYFSGYNDRSKTNSFSMAKTVVTLLLGIAIEEGYIESIDQKIIDFIPEFKEDELGAQASIGSLSSMSSGYDWDESYYNPFSPTVELYYGGDVEDFITSRSFTKELDSYFYYSSASTQLLAIVISKAIKAKNPDATLSEYLSEKIWKPLGMNDDALWHLDNNGMELGYCCLNTNARNFAKLGQLMLNQGNWNGERIISEEYIQLMTTPKFVNNYGYSTWLGLDATVPFYYFRGHLGQYIIIVPSQEMIIVRLGKNVGSGLVEDNIDEYIQQAIAIL